MFNEARHYFVCGNTAQGFVNKLPSNLQGLDQVFVLRGRTGTGKACLMSHLAAACEKTGRPAEYLHCPSAPDTYDGNYRSVGEAGSNRRHRHTPFGMGAVVPRRDLHRF